MKTSLLPLLACPRCEGALAMSDASGDRPGRLVCAACATAYDVVGDVPVLLAEGSGGQAATSALYGDIWESYGRADPPGKDSGYRAPARDHLELLALASGWDLVEGAVGIDAGCGPGAATIALADRHPAVTVVGIDLSPGPRLHAGAAAARPNAHLVQGDLLQPPLARDRFDFVLSFGVLHHTPDPERAFRRLLERLRPGGRITIFLYKDFSDLPAKRAALRVVNLLRSVTTRLPPRLLRALARLLAPLVFGLVTLPARLLTRIGAGRLARHIPYGTFPHLESVAASLEDRFGAPYEFRFSRADLLGWIERARLEEGRVVDCLPYGFSGLVLAGRRPRGAGA